MLNSLFFQYVGLVTSDAKCIDNMNCYKCWGMCENLLQPAWDYMCKEEQRHVCVSSKLNTDSMLLTR